jgi:GxxExxY protein
MEPGNKPAVRRTDLVYPAESYHIKAACLEVHKTLGCGFLEKVYENALSHQLRKDGFGVRQQTVVKVVYDSVTVGEYLIDMLVDDKFIIEVKATEAENPVHKAQLINYLKATGHELGFLVNFGMRSLFFRRLVRTRQE